MLEVWHEEILTGKPSSAISYSREPLHNLNKIRIISACNIIKPAGWEENCDARVYLKLKLRNGECKTRTLATSKDEEEQKVCPY